MVTTCYMLHASRSVRRFPIAQILASPVPGRDGASLVTVAGGGDEVVIEVGAGLRERGQVHGQLAATLRLPLGSAYLLERASADRVVGAAGLV